ncbi:nuclear transport factor 2 family protein [Hyalangium versicolor]|uniref:nuclear transport factor 2 family protein n=1 Tax=Hyalangium versicolor TaxID=2861190 RepID=UPI001CCD1D3A|nr:nuclear transport factor 2 family protein [Hyalangium versicolor]
MNRAILICTAAVVFAGSAWAQDKAPAPAQGAPAMDLSKMGPPARKPTNEKQTKKEIDDFFKKMEAASQKGDTDTLTAMVDFPVYMATDDMKGMPEAKEYNREEYVAMMKPFHENMPKDMKTTHKPTITVLSDSLATVVDDYTMTMGKQKVTGRDAGLLVKRDGQWKWKTMVSAGWGGMEPPKGTGGSGQPVSPEGKK